MPRVCFVTCTTWPEISASDRLVVEALAPLGVQVEGRPWNERSAKFTGFDAVVLRSNWDYHFEPEAFLAWLDRIERAGVRLFNPPALVRWNVSKRYLLALEAAGVPTVATTVLDDPTREAIEASLGRHGPVVVLKPAIAASAHGTRLVPRPRWTRPCGRSRPASSCPRCSCSRSSRRCGAAASGR